MLYVFAVSYVSYNTSLFSPGSWCGGFLDEMNFDVASDAFATIKDLFTRHKADGIVRDFLLANYARLFGEDADTENTATTTAAPTAAATPAAAPTTNGAAGASGGSTVATGTVGGGAGASGGEVHRDARLIGLYGGLLSQSRNFFTRRQSLKLLAELLLDRTNFNIMMKFISSRENLKLVMNL